MNKMTHAHEGTKTLRGQLVPMETLITENSMIGLK